jgi:hypothetical protein
MNESQLLVPLFTGREILVVLVIGVLLDSLEETHSYQLLEE